MLEMISAEAVRRLTAKARGMLTPPAPAPDTAEPRLRNIERALHASDFGCQQNNVRALVEAIIGETLPGPLPSNEPVTGIFTIGSIVVWRGQSLLVMRIDGDGDAYFLRANGDTTCGGNTYISRTHDWEPANEAQVEDFLVAAGVIENARP